FIPNILGQIVIIITFSIPGAIFYEAFLAFIGLGIPSPFASLGVLINDGYKLMKTATYLMVIPALVISALMLSLNIFANGLRDALDPKMRNM
ncbi:MAG: ABC transporter permease subunit, partial [Vallitaleaceae bacterium]|nr:ABC transporter permease subunit [Vallitaleaceae bacterium]